MVFWNNCCFLQLSDSGFSDGHFSQQPQRPALLRHPLWLLNDVCEVPVSADAPNPAPHQTPYNTREAQGQVGRHKGQPKSTNTHTHKNKKKLMYAYHTTPLAWNGSGVEMKGDVEADAEGIGGY